MGNGKWEMGNGKWEMGNQLYKNDSSCLRERYELENRFYKSK